MNQPTMITLSSRKVAKLAVEKDTVFWDRDLTGFGVRVYPTGSKVYVTQARGPGGPKRVAVGRHGVINADEARKRAAHIIARVKAGEEAIPEPLKPAGGPTVAELCARYMEEYVAVRCKPATAALYRSVINRHVLPALGKLPIAALCRAQVAEFHESLYETPAVANMALRTLSAMYELAREWELAPEGLSNPCRSIMKYPERRRERFLTDSEFTRLGEALDEAEARGGVSASAVAAIRLLALTGCRRSEILKLRREDVALEAGELRLPDSKTGARAVPLPPQAVELLRSLLGAHGGPWVIPGRKPGTHLRNIDEAWRTISERAGLADLRLHDLRHSWASRALALGESLPVIGKLLGHSKMETTARYVHLARDSAQEAAGRVAASISEDMLEA